MKIPSTMILLMILMVFLNKITSNESYFILPYSNTSLFDRIGANDFHCDITFPHFVGNDYQQVIIQTKSPRVKSYDHKGYLCSKEIWISTCYENLIGVQEQTFVISPETITASECLDNIQLYREGVLPIPVKPNYQCSWLATNNNPMRYVLVKEYSVSFDHYSMKFVDALFPGGKCTTTTCRTRHDNVIWISKEPSFPTCSDYRIKDMYVYIPKDVKTLATVMIEGDYIPSVSMSTICKGMHYCGEEYLLTPYGHAFQLTPPTERHQIIRLLNDVPTCSQERDVSMTSPDTGLASQLVMEDSTRYERCLDTVTKVNANQKITRRDLGFLSPLSPGFGDAFIATPQGIMKTKVEYIPIESYRMTCDYLTIVR